MMSNIICTPKAGLGNRLRHLVSAKVLADQLGYKLLINWQNEDYIAGFDKLFNYTSEWGKYNNERCDLDIKVETNGVYYSLASLKQYNNICVHGYSRFYFDIDVESWKTKMIQNFNTLTIVDDVKNKLFDIPESSIGMHIRTGDNKQSLNNSPVEKFIKIINNNQDKLIYLATDNRDIETLLLNTYSNIVTHKKTDYDASGNVLGSNIYANKQIINNSNPTKDALIDFLMLSKTSKLYGSYYSSFSEWAAKFSNIPLVIVT